ncbi:MAG: diaminopimelate decarboxylase [Cyanobacterium sp. T60_A2020_053]|nr:diaminopimelate decarboxylase [Cyanobacterium sp. T60_A2020_053]
MLLTEKTSALRLVEKIDAEGSPNQQLLPLSARVNDQNHLEIGGCDVVELVQKFGSSLYIVDELTLRSSARQYRDAFKNYYTGESQVIYASKAWCCTAIVAILASEGIGFDVVSGGELYTTTRALNMTHQDPNYAENKIYLHGNNKSYDELELAVHSKCKIIVDNWLELKNLTEISTKKAQNVSILIRLTPGIECHTHEYIRTGIIDSKFGFDAHQLDEVFAYIKQQDYLQCIGLHAHIGSQIFELQPHHDLAGVLADWYKKALDYGLPMQELNVGGGLGIRYTESDDPPSIDEWVKTVANAVTRACQERNLALPKLISEPGRSLVGSSCITAYTVGGRKEIPNVRTYIAVDGGMSDNPRPITYQSLYEVIIANKMNQHCSETVTVAGKHCESGDILVKNVALPPTETGDILVIMATGAYNYSMASNYNRIARPAAVVVKEGEANLIIRRETLEDLVKQDVLPNRLGE